MIRVILALALAVQSGVALADCRINSDDLDAVIFDLNDVNKALRENRSKFLDAMVNLKKNPSHMQHVFDMTRFSFDVYLSKESSTDTRLRELKESVVKLRNQCRDGWILSKDEPKGK